MKNNYIKKRMRSKITRAKVKEMLKNQEGLNDLYNLYEYGLKKEDLEITVDILRELRLERLYEDLDIDVEKIAKAKKKVVKIRPKSPKCTLISTLYKNHDGNYKIETLLNQFHDSTLQDGFQIGADYGKKFIIDDIQNQRFSKKDIEQMSQEEINEYCGEIRNQI